MKKVIKSVLKVFLIILFTILIIGLLIVSKSYFGRYDTDNEIDCINNSADSYSQIDEIVFRYENDDDVLISYNTDNAGYYFASLDKKNDGNKTLYKTKLLTNGLQPITYEKEWQRITKDIFIIYVDFENDIEEIDCCGYTPVGTKIEYKTAAGKTERCWLYLVDTSQDSDSSSEKFYNYKDIFNFPFNWSYL